MKKQLKQYWVLGSRASPLAIRQSELVRAAMLQGQPDAGISIAIETITTSGDKFLAQSLATIGGKGLFTKELDQALLAGTIDGAVHSLKDVETHITDDHGDGGGDG
ncbi:MAG: hypothetical protein ORN57_03485, partial [Alphaproteobacteria bacterium]|nr:hypothetical protein [Alphaproteobacteria bacterium]